MNEPVNPKKRTRRKFDKAFKQSAVELLLSSGKTATNIAAELGIGSQRLCAWRAEFTSSGSAAQKQAGGGSSAEQLEAENARLRRENDALRQQRDILKKTLGILSEPHTSGINGFTR